MNTPSQPKDIWCRELRETWSMVRHPISALTKIKFLAPTRFAYRVFWLFGAFGSMTAARTAIDRAASAEFFGALKGLFLLAFLIVIITAVVHQWAIYESLHDVEEDKNLAAQSLPDWAKSFYGWFFRLILIVLLMVIGGKALAPHPDASLHAQRIAMVSWSLAVVSVIFGASGFYFARQLSGAKRKDVNQELCWYLASDVLAFLHWICIWWVLSRGVSLGPIGFLFFVSLIYFGQIAWRIHTFEAKKIQFVFAALVAGVIHVFLIVS